MRKRTRLRDVRGQRNMRRWGKIQRVRGGNELLQEEDVRRAWRQLWPCGGRMRRRARLRNLQRTRHLRRRRNTERLRGKLLWDRRRHRRGRLVPSADLRRTEDRLRPRRQRVWRANRLSQV